MKLGLFLQEGREAGTCKGCLIICEVSYYSEDNDVLSFYILQIKSRKIGWFK